MARRREEELLRRVRQGRARRQEADRRGAERQVASGRRHRQGGYACDPPGFHRRLDEWSDAPQRMDNFVRGVRLVSLACGYVAAALIALGVVIVCEMVFVRFVLNENTIWQTDFVTYSLVAATFIGSPYVLMTRGHVNVDVLPLYLEPAPALLARARLDAAGDGVLHRHAGAHLAILARGVGPAVALEHDVAGAAVDSLCVDADRAGDPHAAISRRARVPGHRTRAAVRHRTKGRRA